MKKPCRPIYATVHRVVVPETGEERLALLATHPVDRRLMKERGLRAGDEVRIEIKRKRNPKFHRLVHAIGGLMVDNVEGFELLGSHAAVKQLQRESGICCEAIEIDLGPLGKVQANQAKSIAFDEMEEDEFSALFKGLIAHIEATYGHVLLDDVRQEFELMVNGDQS